MKQKPIIYLTCLKCGFTDPVFQANKDFWKCPGCKEKEGLCQKENESKT
jgi:lipopolysaccharide biosynthesis regulator YciM